MKFPSQILQRGGGQVPLSINHPGYSFPRTNIQTMKFLPLSMNGGKKLFNLVNIWDFGPIDEKKKKNDVKNIASNNIVFKKAFTGLQKLLKVVQLQNSC